MGRPFILCNLMRGMAGVRAAVVYRIILVKRLTLFLMRKPAAFRRNARDSALFHEQHGIVKAEEAVRVKVHIHHRCA